MDKKYIYILYLIFIFAEYINSIFNIHIICYFVFALFLMVFGWYLDGTWTGGGWSLWPAALEQSGTQHSSSETPPALGAINDTTRFHPTIVLMITYYDIAIPYNIQKDIVIPYG